MALSQRQLLNQFNREQKRQLIKTRNIKTKVIDHGFNRIIEELKKLEFKPHVKVGYPADSKKAEEEKQYVARSSTGEKLAILSSEGLTVLDVAIFSEFGTETAPERSFVRATFDKNFRKWQGATKKLLIKIYKGQMTVERALDLLGLMIENDIKSFMQAGEVTPESQRAINEGGKTLIDTAQLVNAITSKKVMKP